MKALMYMFYYISHIASKEKWETSFKDYSVSYRIIELVLKLDPTLFVEITQIPYLGFISGDSFCHSNKVPQNK